MRRRPKPLDNVAQQLGGFGIMDAYDANGDFGTEEFRIHGIPHISAFLRVPLQVSRENTAKPFNPADNTFTLNGPQP